MGLVLGTMYFGTRTDEATSYALLDRYVEAGGRVLDTANCYSFWTSPTGHGGQSEALLGRWLAANPGLRDELVIATKVGRRADRRRRARGPVGRGDRARGGAQPGAPGRRHHRPLLGARRGPSTPTSRRPSRPSVRWSSGASYAGSASPTTRPGGSSRRARSPRGSGVEPYTALQLTTSYVEPRPGAQVPGKDHRFGFVSDETVDYLDTHPELELWVYSPLVQGSFDRADRPFPEAYDHPGTTARLAALDRGRRAHGVPRSQVVLAWMLAPGWKPIVGVSSGRAARLRARRRSAQLTADLLGADSLP